MEAVEYVRKAQFQLRDTVMASDGLCCLIEAINDFDLLIDSVEDSAERSDGIERVTDREPGEELDELRLTITRLHHKIGMSTGYDARDLAMRRTDHDFINSRPGSWRPFAVDH